MRTGPATAPVPTTVVDEVQSPTILAPQPTTSRLLRATPATEYPVRSVSPDLVPDAMISRIPDPEWEMANGRATPELVPDRMAERIPEAGADAELMRRLTPAPEQQFLGNANAPIAV